MVKEVFTPAYLDSYRNDPRIVTALNGCKLLTHDEFISWYDQTTIRMSSRLSGRTNRQPSIKKVKEQSDDILIELANKVCENKIDDQYGVKAILNLNKDLFDLLVVLAPDYENIKRDERNTYPELAMNKKIRHVLGFIIIEKGECKKLPNTYTVNLICSRSKTDYVVYGKRRSEERQRVRAAFLLGAYL
jgi:hypothetical protein